MLFNSCSILFSITGLFFGPLPTMVAILIAGLVRVALGGVGLKMGLAVVVLSGLVGLGWKRLRPFWRQKNSALELLGMAFSVHLVLLGFAVVCTPAIHMAKLLDIILFPILLFSVPVTVFLGLFMKMRATNWVNKQALRDSLMLYSALVENTPDFIWFKDVDGRFIRINEAHVRHLGIDRPSDAVGKTDFDFFNKEHAQKSWKDEQAIILNRIPLVNVEEQKFWADGRISWVITSRFPLMDSHRKVVGTFGVSKDITSYKKLEMELRAAKEKAEGAERMKACILRNLSHEIRTPMNAIVGFSRLVKDPKINEQERAQFLGIVIENSDLLLGVVDNLLRMASIESDREKLNERFVNINRLGASIYDTFLNKCEGTGLDLSFQKGLPDSEAFVFADEAKMLIIFSNLLANAFKFTYEGSVSFGYVKEEGLIRFFVKDTGIGISEDLIETVFDRFMKIETDKNMVGGLGLGLSLCRDYLKMMNGKIWVESTLNVGTTIFFTLSYNEAAIREKVIGWRDSRMEC